MHIIDQSKHDYLFIDSKNTNTTYPNSEYVTGDSFPEQIDELINTEIELRYRLKNFFSSNDDEHEYHRPYDDTRYIDREALTPEDKFYYKTGRFIVLRADVVEPYVLIAKSPTRDFYVINSTRLNELDEYEFLTRVCTDCAQNTEYQEAYVLDIYDNTEHYGKVYRIDDGEEFIIIIEESIGESESRWVLGSEVMSTLVSNVEE